MLTRTDAIEAALSEGGEPIVADVLGVVCDFCALAMNKIFGKRGEVAALYVDLDTKALEPGADARRFPQRRGHRRPCDAGRLPRRRCSARQRGPRRPIVRGDWRDTIAPTLALFGSASTLLCCALPALLISLGAGAVMAGLTSAIPGIMWLSAHKDVLFVLSGLLMTLSSLLWWQQRSAPCPVDPVKAAGMHAPASDQRLAAVTGLGGLPLSGLFFAYLMGAAALLIPASHAGYRGIAISPKTAVANASTRKDPQQPRPDRVAVVVAHDVQRP